MIGNVTGMIKSILQYNKIYTNIKINFKNQTNFYFFFKFSLNA
jgi:hypothetical protein